MKKLFMLTCIISMLSCKNEPKIDYALFSGSIENPKGENAQITKGRDNIKTFKLDANGTFTDTLRIEPGYYNFNHGGERTTFYVAPGEDLNISLNTKEFDETIVYSGKGSENNNYLAKKYLEDEKMDDYFTELFSSKETDFVNKLENITADKVNLLNASSGLSDAFKVLEDKNIHFEHLGLLMSYPYYHQNFTKNDDFKVSEDFYKSLDDIDYSNEEDYHSLDSYKNLMHRYYLKKIKESDTPEVVFQEINTNGFKELKDHFASLLVYEVSPNNEKNKAYFDGIMLLSSDDKLKSKLETKYKKVKLLAKGMPSPAFVKYENHKGGNLSLEELKGKYVYVDVWATWCGPCKREIPYLKDIENKYHDKNIEFVSTSIDKAKDHNTWVEMVKTKELGGIQLFADNDWNSKFVTDYAIEGIPRFILVDPNGNIVTANAPRPSDPKLIELLNELKI